MPLRFHFFLFHILPEPVRTEQEGIVCPDRTVNDKDIRRDKLLASENARKFVLIPVISEVFARYESVFHIELSKGMIRGAVAYLTGYEPVDAGVSYMGYDRAIVVGEHSRESGARAVSERISTLILDDQVMRTLSKCYDAAGRKISVFYKTVAHSASADLACHVASVIGAESVAHDKTRFVALYPAISVILIII